MALYEMISGLNQEVNVLGRVFHFQTELTRKGNLFIRTEIFVGGKIVASRETPLPRERGQRLEEEAVRTAMKEQHCRVIESTRQRVESYQARKETPSSAEPPEPEADALDLGQARELGPPPNELRVAVGSAIRIRRLFGKVRLRLGLDSPVSAPELAARLATASRGFAWILGSPTFAEIRVDEQVRCHLVCEQVNEWLGKDPDPMEAERLWTEITTFNDYVAEINKRADLIAFDRQLLMWTAFRIQSQGISDPILDHLQWLSGRDPEIDKLLDASENVSSETWFATLCRVLARIPGEDA